MRSFTFAHRSSEDLPPPLALFSFVSYGKFGATKYFRVTGFVFSNISDNLILISSQIDSTSFKEPIIEIKIIDTDIYYISKF